MITDFSQTALNSGMLAMLLGEMAFPKMSQEGYEILRVEAQKLLDDTEELAGIALPTTVHAMSGQDSEIVGSIAARLSTLRSRVGGDVLPLTMFMMTHCVHRGVLFAAFDDKEDWPEFRELLLLCLDDVGIEGEREVRTFERRSREIAVHEGDDVTLSSDDRRTLIHETIQRLWELIHQRWSEPVAVSEQLAALNTQMEALRAVTNEFRRESHDEHREILESLGQLQKQLISRLEAQGVPKAQARELADTKSQTFMQRVGRWARSAKARDAAEGALWAALDFVPAGTTVKLGLKVAQAIRRASK